MQTPFKIARNKIAGGRRFNIPFLVLLPPGIPGGLLGPFCGAFFFIIALELTMLLPWFLSPSWSSQSLSGHMATFWN
jgi:hypothetical protein